MNAQHTLDRGVSSFHFDFLSSVESGFVSGRFPFITISRQSFAGGCALGEKIVNELGTRPPGDPFSGFRIYDKELCRRVAEDHNLSSRLEFLINEEYHGALQDTLAQVFAGTPSQLAVFHRTFDAIRNLAALGRCIIIGRGGFVLTRDLPCGVHVRLVAEFRDRVAALCARERVDKLEAEPILRRQDADKARMIREQFKRDIEDPLNYDFVFNTSRVPLDVVAKEVLMLAEERYRIFKDSQMSRGGPAYARR